MKLYILRLGMGRMDSIKMRQYATLATLSHPNVMHEWVNVPVWAVLIQHEEGNVLFDLGCLPNAMEDGWLPRMQEGFPWSCQKDENLVDQLALIGLKPEDIDIVVASHLHIDHFGGIDKVAHADVYVPKEDWLNGLMMVHQSTNTDLHGGYVKSCFEVGVKRYHPVAIGEDFELLPGIELVTLPGHAPNLLGMIVHLENSGNLLFPSDSVYTREIYGPPACLPGICYDNISFLKSVEKVRRLQKKYDATIMFAHDEEMYNTYKKAPLFYD